MFYQARGGEIRRLWWPLSITPATVAPFANLTRNVPSVRNPVSRNGNRRESRQSGGSLVARLFGFIEVVY